MKIITNCVIAKGYFGNIMNEKTRRVYDNGKFCQKQKNRNNNSNKWNQIH